MRKLKALLASITALSCLCVSCFPMAEQIPPRHSIVVSAEEEEIVTSGTCGENLTWNFEKSTGTLIISGTGSMENWNMSPMPDWFYFREDIKKIIIEDGVTAIGSCAFWECTALESITIPNSVTAIGWSAFYFCTALESITIPDSVTVIGRSVFYDCTALESITIPDSVTTIGELAFRSTSWLKIKQNENPFVIINGILIDGSTCEQKEIMIPDSVTTIGYDAFRGCSALKSIIIPDSVTTIGDYAFSGCTALESITIPDSVTTIGKSAFFDTPWLTTKQNENPFVIINRILIDATTCEQEEIMISDSVTAIGGEAFKSCTALKSLTIPDSVTTIGEVAFYHCDALESITIPNSVTTIGEYAFFDCDALESITIENLECKIDDSESTLSDTATIYGYDNSTAQAYAKKYERNFVSLGTAPEILIGDADKDGEFNILDIITLQKWLLNTGDLPNWKAVDFNQDGMITIFDFVLAKKYYLERI
ncbi:MAG: leucine-rich repeat protein [Oscillospiraceae bacterium]|nr:leucine-rich repeat protein [Oscillospiraceae bacterium]